MARIMNHIIILFNNYHLLLYHVSMLLLRVPFKNYIENWNAREDCIVNGQDSVCTCNRKRNRLNNKNESQ